MLEENNEPQTTLRDTLESNFDAVSEAKEPIERARDESGKFVKTETKQEVSSAPAIEAPKVEEEPIQRPTTWKKQYLPIYDKLVSGQQLTPEEAKELAKYSSQREKEYASGVSTYRAEAQNAKELQGAIEPFLPILQQHNIKPAEWIGNLGRAHQMLVQGSPEQKLQMFTRLAQDYGVPLGAIGRQDVDPVVPQLMQYIQNLEGKVNNVHSWREQMEMSAIRNEIAQFNDAEKYPHFEAVRPIMAQLLETGMAHDLKTAYNKAIRMDDDVWSSEQERVSTANAAKQQAQNQIEAAKQAKNRAISPKSSTPSGAAVSGKQDRRSILEEQLGSLGGRV